LAAYTRKIENLVENVSQDSCPPGTTTQIQWRQPIGSQRSLFFFDSSIPFASNETELQECKRLIGLGAKRVTQLR